ncbi:hypothetical protein ES703_53534 [subsurface metagenome]
MAGLASCKIMSFLNKFVEPHVDEMPGATYRLYHDIPATECDTPTGPPTLPEVTAAMRAIGCAYTFVNRALYTDCSEEQAQAFCSVFYDPQIDEPLWSKQ